jgi:hypothetical protein
VTRFLVATASVHTTAAACDYLTDRLAADDEVRVLTVREDGSERGNERDAADAVNVASVRLAGIEADVRTVEREGAPAAEILACAEAIGADEVLLAAHGGPLGAGGDADLGPEGAVAPDTETDAAESSAVGATAGRVLAGADRPVVVPLA